MRVTPPLLGGHHQDGASEINNQQLVNWEVHEERPGGVGRLSLKPSAGLTLLTTQGNGPCRSHAVKFQDKSYWVSGSQLFSIDENWDVVLIGSLASASSWCVLAAGRDYLMVVDGTDGYTWNGSAFATVSDGDFPTAPTWVVQTDGTFYVNDATTDRVYASDFSTGSENPTTWAALDYVVAEADPDDVVAMARTFDNVYFIGSRTTQIYYKSGNADFPLSLSSNGVLEFGTDAPASVDTAKNGSIFMLARTTDGGIDIVRVDGFQVESIVEPDMLDAFEAYERLDDAEGFAYTQGQHTYYELTFPTESVTWVYATKTREWHQRQSYGLTRHRVRGHGFFNGRHLVGDYENGNLYYLDPTSYTENGYTIIRTRVTALVNKDGKPLECNELEVHFKRGVGLVTGQGSDPEAMLRYSIDGGQTWSNTMRRSMGQIGDTVRRAVWDRLGQGFSFMFEISVSDPVEAVVIAIYADIVELNL